MRAIRVHPASVSSLPYSPANPAPSSSLHLDQIPQPKPKCQGELLVRVKATTVIRDELTWPETYATEYAIPGHDLSGIVEETYKNPGDVQSIFKSGDEIFGMTHADRGSAWADYTVVKEEEIAQKPKNLNWEQAASLPLSALTAYQALFKHGGIPLPVQPNGDERHLANGQKILVTGASGGVGIYLVQLAAAAGLYVVAATSSNARNESFLKSLGAHDTVEYTHLQSEAFDVIIDTVGGEILANCWKMVSKSGVLISVDSSSFDFVNIHRQRGFCDGKENVKALFFIVSSDSRALGDLANLAEAGYLKSFVVETYELTQAREAYEKASIKASGHGKIVMRV
ncbi:hypothetical protein N7447_001903 [Penicillium robsamsonii]|uniref:uncharacterized protein n=1 Tax=Penicillium robsamsonii TaxID=1792511 RepID=UPI002546E4CF|nr:uncharacterized protein N7447_001903 [Penicillium robsamsonii]KAJ5835877.1 hypothetical protein N7447_001903 [Penicillium robsamsonii]